MTPLETAVEDFKRTMYYVNAWRDDEEWEYMERFLKPIIVEAIKEGIEK